MAPDAVRTEDKTNKICTNVDDGALVIRFSSPLSILSWAPFNGGAFRANAVLNLQVPRNAGCDGLIESIDFPSECRRRGLCDSTVGLLTAADVGDFSSCRLDDNGLWVDATATVGLTNARSVRDVNDVTGPRSPGTINLVVATNGLPTMAGRLEALHVAAAAKTAALRDAGIVSAKSRAPADITGTDVIVVGSDGTIAADHCGLHTPLGSLIGRAVHDVVTRGIARFLISERSS